MAKRKKPKQREHPVTYISNVKTYSADYSFSVGSGEDYDPHPYSEHLTIRIAGEVKITTSSKVKLGTPVKIYIMSTVREVDENYSCRARGTEKVLAEARRVGDNHVRSYLPDSQVRPSAHWAACMKRTFEIDPLLCPKCQSPMKIKAFITDPHEIARISKNLGIHQAQAPPQLPCAIALAA